MQQVRRNLWGIRGGFRSFY